MRFNSILIRQPDNLTPKFIRKSKHSRTARKILKVEHNGERSVAPTGRYSQAHVTTGLVGAEGGTGEVPVRLQPAVPRLLSPVWAAPDLSVPLSSLTVSLGWRNIPELLCLSPRTGPCSTYDPFLVGASACGPSLSWALPCHLSAEGPLPSPGPAAHQAPPPGGQPMELTKLVPPAPPHPLKPTVSSRQLMVSPSFQ